MWFLFLTLGLAQELLVSPLEGAGTKTYRIDVILSKAANISQAILCYASSENRQQTCDEDGFYREYLQLERLFTIKEKSNCFRLLDVKTTQGRLVRPFFVEPHVGELIAPKDEHPWYYYSVLTSAVGLVVSVMIISAYIIWRGNTRKSDGYVSETQRSRRRAEELNLINKLEEF